MTISQKIGAGMILSWLIFSFITHRTKDKKPEDEYQSCASCIVSIGVTTAIILLIP